MNNVWGRGGLFEQALASKLNNQDAETALKGSQVGVDAMNANTKMTEVGNNYDLGMRTNAVQRGMLDVNRMNADTERLANSPPSLITDTVANNLGLRTFNPVSQQTATEFGQTYGGANLFQKPANSQSGAAQPASTSTTSIFRSGNSFSDKPFGMKNGGLVMKPKMVKQPGYMHGGKITPPKGYENGGVVGSQTPEWVVKSLAETRAKPEFKQAIDELTKKGWKPNPKDPESDVDAVDKYLFATKTLPEMKARRGYKAGGMIGDVKKDTGRDTIDAKVRPGEYMLNPETVAHIGGGNYEAGVRNLNQIVREATGKEPGPTPVGKSGKAGYVWSGVVDDYGNMMPGREVPVMDNYGNLQAQSWNRSMPPGASSPVGGAPSAASGSASARGAGMGARFAQGVDDVLNMNVGDAARKGARVVRGAADAVKDATVAAMKNPVARVAGKVAQPLVLMDQANETFKTPTDEMYRRYGFDENDSSFMHDVGVRGLDFLQGVGNTVTFGVADRLGNLMAGNGFVRSPRYRDSVTETVVDPTNGAMPPPPKENADKSGDAAAQPSLRDMMLARLQNIDRVAATNGGLGMRYWNNARNEAVNSLTELDKADTMAGATMANLRATAGNKVREDADKRISERFQIPVYDNDGKIKGYEKDPNAANALRDFAAQIYGMDYYSLPQAQQDVVMQAYDVNSRGTRRLNERLASEGGGSARVSMLPRVGANSLRNDGEISFGDIGDPNISLNDWLTSFGPNQMEKMVLRDPVTGQRVAARHVLRNESGTIDDDLIAQINSAAAAQVKKQK